MDSDSTIYWTEELSIGNPAIDDEHARIFQLYTKLANTLNSEEFDNRLFAEVLNGMFDYSLHHFRREELYMKLMGYPELEAHKVEHGSYTLYVSRLSAEFFSANPPNPSRVLSYLADWWLNHILKVDILYEQYRQNSHPELTIDWTTLSD